MAEKYAVGAQAAGFISFKEPIKDESTYSPTDQHFNIPEGMICIGDNGKGYVIPAQASYDFNPPVTDGTHVLYAISPIDGSGIASIAHDTYSNYVAGGGDTDNRRSFCYFSAESSEINPASLITFDSSINIKSSRTLPLSGNDEDVKLNLGVYEQLKNMGIYLNSTTDVNFLYRGQHIMQGVTLHSSVENWDLVYLDSDNIFYPALGGDGANPEKEIVVGIAEKGRDGITGNDFVITSGVISLGVSKLPDVDYPTGTYLYLSESATLPDASNGYGKIVRDFDFWTVSHSYALGERIAIITDTDNLTGWVLEVQVAGSSGSSEPIWTVGAIGDTDGDGSVTWECVAPYDTSFLGDRKIRIGVSMGNGDVLVQLALTTQIDDHDESAYAHSDLQIAMQKAGIYVQNTSQGLTDHAYVGQMFDENATFGDVAEAEISIVYRNSGGTYDKAIAGVPSKEAVVGISHNVTAGASGTVLHGGFVEYDTSSFTLGAELYLSEATLGALTATISTIKLATVITVGASGVILLETAGASGYAHAVSPTAHDLIQLAIRKAGIFVTGGDYAQEYVGQPFDENPTLEAGLANFDVVYYGDYAVTGTDKYRRAIAGPDLRAKYLGVVVDDSNFTQVASSGYIDIGVTGTNQLPTGTFPAGTDVYLSTSGSGNCYTDTITTVKLGIALGNGVLLLIRSGSGSGTGTGDVSFEDGIYLQLLEDHTFSKVYYDLFDQEGTVDTVTGATYDFQDSGLYAGVSGNLLEHNHTFSSGGFVYDPKDLSWENKIGTTFDEDTTTLSKTGGVDLTWDAGATSIDYWNEADGDFIIEFSADQTDNDVTFGLSKGNADEAATDVDFGIRLQADETWRVSESGANPWDDNETYTIGDIFGVSCENGVVKYYKNGVLKYTSVVTPTYPLLVDSSFYDAGASVNSMRWTALDGTTSHNKILVHGEFDRDVNMKLEYEYPPSTWNKINFNEITNLLATVPNINLRLTWRGTGDVRSFGVLYDFEEIPMSMGRLHESYVLQGGDDKAQGDSFIVPQNGKFNNNGKSLVVIRNGVVQELQKSILEGGDGAGDYLETSTSSIEIRTAGGWSTSDRLVFIEPYSQVDVSTDNNTRINVEHDENGAHTLTDKVTDKAYYLEVHNGLLKLIPINN